MDQRYYITQHRLRELWHTAYVWRPPLVNQSPRVLERQKAVEIVRVQPVSRLHEILFCARERFISTSPVLPGWRATPGDRRQQRKDCRFILTLVQGVGVDGGFPFLLFGGRFGGLPLRSTSATVDVDEGSHPPAAKHVPTKQPVPPALGCHDL